MKIQMKSGLIVCSLFLNSCVYYGDIHRHSEETNLDSLTTSHHYQPHSINSIHSSHTPCAWWKKFNDPELNELIDVALQDSPNMKIAESRVRAAMHLTEEAYATLWPSVDLTGYLQRQRFSETGLIPPPFNGKIFNIGDLALNFNYEFDFWGKNRQTLKAKINESRAAQAELADAELVLSAAVAEVYFQLSHDLTEVDIAKEKLAINQKLFRITQTRMQHGIESAIPVKTILADLAESKEKWEQAKQDAILSRNQLALLLGKNALTTDIKVNHFVFHAKAISIPASLPAHLLANRPDICAAKLRTEAAANQVNVAKAYFFPDINLSALYSYQSIHLNKLFLAENRNNAITGAIDLPIFDAGARRAMLKVKYAEFDLAVNEYNETLLNALRDVSDQLTKLRSIRNQLRAEQVSYDAIQHNYFLYQSRYHHGIADSVEVLENKNIVLQQKTKQLALQTQQVQTIVALLKALGGKDA